MHFQYSTIDNELLVTDVIKFYLEQFVNIHLYSYTFSPSTSALGASASTSPTDGAEAREITRAAKAINDTRGFMHQGTRGIQAREALGDFETDSLELADLLPE